MSKCSPAYGYKNVPFKCPNFRWCKKEEGFLGSKSYWAASCSCTGEQLRTDFIDSVCTEKGKCTECRNYKKYGIRN